MKCRACERVLAKTGAPSAQNAPSAAPPPASFARRAVTRRPDRPASSTGRRTHVEPAQLRRYGHRNTPIAYSWQRVPPWIAAPASQPLPADRTNLATISPDRWQETSNLGHHSLGERRRGPHHTSNELFPSLAGLTTQDHPQVLNTQPSPRPPNTARSLRSEPTLGRRRGHRRYRHRPRQVPAGHSTPPHICPLWSTITAATEANATLPNSAHRRAAL